MRNRGKLVIVAIFGLALIAAGFSTWFHYRGQHRTQKFWGTTTALVIAQAPHVEAFELGESVPSDEVAPDATVGETERPAWVEFAGVSTKITRTKDVSKARGMSNLRQALVIDATFDWKTAPTASEATESEPHWQYALEFNDGLNWATVLFDFESHEVALTGGKKTARLDATASAEFKTFFDEQFSDEPGADKGPSESSDTPAVEPAAKE